MPTSSVYRVVARECVSLFEAAGHWSPLERQHNRCLLARIYDKVTTALIRGKLKSRRFASTYQGSRMRAYVAFQAFDITISIIDVTFDGGDRYGKQARYEKTRVFMIAEIVREGSAWSIEHIEGEPIQLPEPCNHADKSHPKRVLSTNWESVAPVTWMGRLAEGMSARRASIFCVRPLEHGVANRPVVSPSTIYREGSIFGRPGLIPVLAKFASSADQSYYFSSGHAHRVGAAAMRRKNDDMRQHEAPRSSGIVVPGAGSNQRSPPRGFPD